MAARFRIALQGFGEFERNALSFCLKHAGARVPAYTQVEKIADCDFIVADASQPQLDGSIVRGERLRDTLFVGDQPPPQAAAHVARPLDPERILRALDRMVLQRLAPRRAPPDVVLPVAPPDPGFPVLDIRDIVEDTTPAAFQHEPLDIALKGAGELAAEAQAEERKEPPPQSETVADDYAPPPEPPRRARPAPAPPAPEPSDDERRAAKAQARRRARAARLAQAGREAAPLADVLVLTSDAAGGNVAALLEGFGFTVTCVGDIDTAMEVLEKTALAAAFLEIGAENDDGVDAIGLCQMVKQGRIALAAGVPAVMLIARRKAASESVRAKLAGCDAYLTQPVGRGDVARAIEACDLVMPADQRRSPR